MSTQARSASALGASIKNPAVCQQNLLNTRHLPDVYCTYPRHFTINLTLTSTPQCNSLQYPPDFIKKDIPPTYTKVHTYIHTYTYREFHKKFLSSSFESPTFLHITIFFLTQTPLAPILTHLTQIHWVGTFLYLYNLIKYNITALPYIL